MLEKLKSEKYLQKTVLTPQKKSIVSQCKQNLGENERGKKEHTDLKEAVQCKSTRHV